MGLIEIVRLNSYKKVTKSISMTLKALILLSFCIAYPLSVNKSITCSNDLVIRDERVAEHQSIYRITRLAFIDRPYAAGDEQDLINRLRAVGALTISLVVLIDDDLVGQATFSPASQSDGSAPWYALGPISVHPDHQSLGIGSALIAEGFQRLQERSALGCILTGDPAYYERFGFVLSPSHTPKTESPQSFQVKFFTDFRPQGIFSFHQAFYD